MPRNRELSQERPRRRTSHRADMSSGNGTRPPRPNSRPSAKVPKKVDGILLGPYETTYQVAEGYAIERTIIRP